MPLYDYECEAGHRYEIRLPFGTPAQQPCETCGKPARRLLSAPVVVFKGSGWYSTDSQRSLRTGVGTERGDGSSDSDSSSNDAGGTDSAADAPAAKKAAPSANGKGAKASKAKAAPADD